MSNTKFKKKWGTLTEIGELFGMSAVVLGRKMKELGLRNPNGTPSTGALGQGLAMTQQLRNGATGCWWNRSLLPARLQQAGLTRLHDKPSKALALCRTLAKTRRAFERMAEDGNPCDRFAWDAMEMDVREALDEVREPERVALVAEALAELDRSGFRRDEVRDLFPKHLVAMADARAAIRARTPMHRAIVGRQRELIQATTTRFT